MRRPRGQRRRPSTSSVSSSSWKSLTSIAPWWRSSAEKARAEPTTAPECASAARAAACERPTLRQTTGLPASAAARQRGGERAGPPDRLDEQADRARALVLGQEPDEVGQIARELAPGRDDRAKADARTAGQERLADRARVGDAGHVPGHERVGSRNGAEPERDAARRRDAHAVRPHHRHVALGGARRRCARRPRGPRRRPRRPARVSRLRAHRPRSRPRRPPPRACGRRAGRRTPGAPGSAATESKHSRPSTAGPVRIHEPGRSAAAPAPAGESAAPSAVRSLAPTTATERGKSKGRIPPRSVGRSHGTSAPSQVSASAGSSPP